MEQENENLKARWEDIGNNNVNSHNRIVKNKKIASVVILVVLILINAFCSVTFFLGNNSVLGSVMAAFGLLISFLYFIQTVKPAFKEPYKVYDPASNPII